MSLRQRHMDPQLAMGSQRLVEGCLLGGHQGEGSPYPSRSRTSQYQSPSQSYGQFENFCLPPLSSAVSHPAIFCASSTPPQSLSSLLSCSSSCLPSSLGSSHSAHVLPSSYFQPMDTISDSASSDLTRGRSRLSGSFGYPSARPSSLLAPILSSPLLSFPLLLFLPSALSSPQLSCSSLLSTFLACT